MNCQHFFSILKRNIPSWPEIHCVDQTGLKIFFYILVSLYTLDWSRTHRGQSASASKVLGLKVCFAASSLASNS